MPPVSSGKKDHRIRLFNKDQLAGKEKMKGHQFAVTADKPVGLLREGKLDIDSETSLPAGPFMTGLHDARPGAGNDHKPLFDEPPPEVNRHLVVRIFFFDTSGTKDAYFAVGAVRGEKLKSVAQFLNGTIET